MDKKPLAKIQTFIDACRLVGVKTFGSIALKGDCNYDTIADSLAALIMPRDIKEFVTCQRGRKKKTAPLEDDSDKPMIQRVRMIKKLAEPMHETLYQYNRGSLKRFMVR